MKSNEKNKKIIIVFLENDLRLCDNPALYYALKLNLEVLILYCFDEKSEKTRSINENKKWWLQKSLESLHQELQKYKQKLHFFIGSKITFFTKLLSTKINIEAVYFNINTDPFIHKSNQELTNFLEINNVLVKSFLSSTLFDPEKILNKEKSPYKIFTSFWNECKKQNFNLSKNLIISKSSFKTEHILKQKLNCNFTDIKILTKSKSKKHIILEKLWTPGEQEAKKLLKSFESQILNYDEQRNIPSINGTSKLSPHIHFGEISIKYIFNELLKKFNINKIEAFLKELIWREFSTYLLFHFPELVTKPFQKKFEKLEWSYKKDSLKKWSDGLTGYPIVDAGMRELLKTGWMHNRVRMIVASFLTKDLLINWTKGEEYFWTKLLDGDTCSNVVNWQWVAGCGVDPSPFFRIFNPILQGKKFDPNGDYIKEFVPELKELPKKYIHVPWLAPTNILEASNIKLNKDYPKPIVDHCQQREIALKLFKKIH